MINDTDKGSRLLSEAYAYYGALAQFRKERLRNKRYNYGDQWSDEIEVDGRRITEEQYIREQGCIPLKNNLIRRLVRNVTGVYNSRATEPVYVAHEGTCGHCGDIITRLLRHNMQLNRMSALYTRSIEEFLISGMVVHRKSYGRRCGVTDCWTDYVQPGNFFVDTRMRDFRGWDCTCVGEVHDVTFEDVCRQFASADADISELAEAFGEDTEERSRVGQPLSTGLCRVVEIWRRELMVSAGGMNDVWRYYFVAPSGMILAQGDTPYAHGSHPYVFKAYPMIDGEIHSFVADVVDQQRYTNRLITMYDLIMRASSKGVLLVPDDCVPRGCSPSDFADTWSRHNGVLFYHPSAQGHVPQQVAGNYTNIGIREMLDLQLKFFEDISGVSDALQGKKSNVGVSAELYGQQTQNATTTLADILDTFDEFVRDATVKDVHNIRQYYSDDRISRIIGSDVRLTSSDRRAEFDLNIVPSSSTPAILQNSNAMLMDIWKSGQITLEQMLRAGSFPFADSLLGLRNRDS